MTFIYAFCVFLFLFCLFVLFCLAFERHFVSVVFSLSACPSRVWTSELMKGLGCTGKEKCMHTFLYYSVPQNIWHGAVLRHILEFHIYCVQFYITYFMFMFLFFCNATLNCKNRGYSNT